MRVALFALAMMIAGPAQAGEFRLAKTEVPPGAMAIIALEEGLTPRLGDAVRITIYNSEDSFLETPFAKVAGVIDENGVARIALDALPAGVYAMAAYLDEDGDGKLRRGAILGRPKEPLGFSNGAKISLGAPDFKDARVEVAPGAVIEITLLD